MPLGAKNVTVVERNTAGVEVRDAVFRRTVDANRGTGHDRRVVQQQRCVSADVRRWICVAVHIVDLQPRSIDVDADVVVAP